MYRKIFGSKNMAKVIIITAAILAGILCFGIILNKGFQDTAFQQYGLPIYTVRLTHDDSSQKIVLDAVNTEAGQFYALRVIGNDGKPLWQCEAATPHSGWNTIFLTRIEGKDYMMQYNPYMIQGSGSYCFRVFSLDKDGNEIVLDQDKVDFGINPPGASGHFRKRDIEPVKAFYVHVNQYFPASELLLNTDEHINLLLPERRGLAYGAQDNPITGFYDYFFGNAELSIDEQMDLFVQRYINENGALEN